MAAVRGFGTHRNSPEVAFAMLEMRAVMRTILQSRSLGTTSDPGESMTRRHFAVAPGSGGLATFAPRMHTAAGCSA